MSDPKQAKLERISFHVPKGIRAVADKIALKRSTVSHRITRADVLREWIENGAAQHQPKKATVQ